MKFCSLVLFNFILIDKCRHTQLIDSENYSMKQVVFDNQFFVIRVIPQEQISVHSQQ